MKKRILSLICLTVFCITALLPVCGTATTPLNPAEEASLTLHYQKDGVAFPDLTVSIYRVAEAFADGTFSLIAPYTTYPINIHDITKQEQWTNTATTLNSYIVSNHLPADREGKTDETGTVFFDSLKTGLYLVDEVIADNNAGTYLFNRFLVYLPTPMEDGTFDYTVEANPKCVGFVPKTEYRIIKLWKDTGHQADRPSEILVDIYREGVLQETKTLNEANNWSYTWYVSEEDRGTWTVMEHKVKEEYTLTIQENKPVFSLINTHNALEDPNAPPTGDTPSLLPWLLALSLSGTALLLLGLYRRWRA